MKGIRREKIINYSGLLRTLDGLVPYLRENFVYVDKNQRLTGDAPKLFIREYEYGTALKNNPQKWPAYIAKVGHKWYPVESRSEEHTSELQSRGDLVCGLLLEEEDVLVRVLH